MQTSTTTAMWSLGKTMLGMAVCNSNSSSVGKGTTYQKTSVRIQNMYISESDCSIYLLHTGATLFQEDVIQTVFESYRVVGVFRCACR